MDGNEGRKRCEPVVFAVANDIYYYRHDQLEPVHIIRRQSEVTSFTLTKVGLMDSCIDGHFSYTASRDIFGRFPYAPLIGIHNPPEELLAKYPEGLGDLIYVSNEEGSVDIQLERTLLHRNSGCRPGKCHSVISGGIFHWANAQHVYRGFNKSNPLRRFNCDFPRFVPLSFEGKFLYLHSLRDRSDPDCIETREIIEYPTGTELWSNNYAEHGSIVVAGVYRWNEVPYLLLVRNFQPELHTSWEVHTIAIPEIHNKEPKKIATLTTEQPNAYGMSNPFLASERLREFPVRPWDVY